MDQFEKSRLLDASEIEASPAWERAVAPSNARNKIVRLGISLAFLAYVDRACISQAAPNIMRDLHLTKLQMGYVFSAFGFTYAVFELPAGWLCDRVGARVVLARVVVCWWC